jgi:hypothetical protein
MKLHELPRDKRFKLIGDKSETIYLLDRVEEGYGICYINNNIVLLSCDFDIIEVD